MITTVGKTYGSYCTYLDDDIIEITEIVQSISNTELPADKLNYPPNNVTFCSGNTE